MADFYLKTGDTAPALKAQFLDDLNAPIDLTGASVRFYMTSSGGQKIVDAVAAITDAANGKVTYAWQSGDSATAGDYVAEFKVTFANGTVQRVPNNGSISLKISKSVS